ncbi:hypothetical protein OKN36_10270 [Furfurilactobacillus sp. OKN36]
MRPLVRHCLVRPLVQEIQPLLWQWGRSLSVLLLVMAAGMVFGSVMSLFAWRGKMVLMVAGGATGLAMLTLLAKAMTGIDTSYMDTWVGPIVRLMFGFHGTHGMQYPGNLIVTNLVFVGLGLAISYGFNQLLRLRWG